MSLKPLAWTGSALDDLKAFPDDARQRAGFELYRLQRGLEPTDWKPMPMVGAGVREIRIQTGRAFRVLFVAKFGEAVYVPAYGEARPRLGAAAACRGASPTPLPEVML